MFKFLFLENIFTYLYMPNNSVRRKRQKGGLVPTGEPFVKHEKEDG